MRASAANGECLRITLANTIFLAPLGRVATEMQTDDHADSDRRAPLCAELKVNVCSIMRLTLLHQGLFWSLSGVVCMALE